MVPEQTSFGKVTQGAQETESSKGGRRKGGKRFFQGASRGNEKEKRGVRYMWGDITTEKKKNDEKMESVVEGASL